MALLANQPFEILLVTSKFEGDEGGLKLARESCKLHPRVRVVMLLESPERESVVQAFRAGCNGVFCHPQSVKELTKCLDCVHRGQIWANSQELNYVVKALRELRPLRAIETGGSAPLTEREMAVVRCVADGLTNKEVAAKSGVSQHTIKNFSHQAPLRVCFL